MCFYQYNLVVDPPSCVCFQFTPLWTRKHNISGDEDGTMPSLGKIEEFDPASTNINRYLERLEQYFIANGVPADTGERFKRRATLISVIGSKAYDVLSDLCSPEAPSEKTYGERPFCSEETSYRGMIPISPSIAFKSKEKAFPPSPPSSNTSLLPTTSAQI